MGDPTNDENLTIWTIGHSNQSFEQFLDLLKRHQIDDVVDVRSSPYSRYATHFSKEAIEDSLARHRIRYIFLGDLIGGRPAETKFYDSEGCVLYGKLAESPKFQKGLDRLLEEIEMYRVAILCGEEDPTECHRRLLIGRMLSEKGVAIRHIRGDGRAQTEAEVAEEEELRSTKGQLSLFEMEAQKEWKSTRSVLPRRAPRSSSAHSDEWEYED
ncbi:MAG: DUF488 domain-containing protein [Chloroflexota bacterium]